MIKFNDYEVSKYLRCGWFENGIAMVELLIRPKAITLTDDILAWFKEQYAFINKSGKIISAIYTNAKKMSEGMIAVQNDNQLWGFIDTTGKEVIPCKYKNVSDFKEGLAPVMDENDLWGFIDKKGKEIIPCQYKRVSYFKEGLCAIDQENDGYGVIDKTGKEIVQSGTGLNYISSFSNGAAVVNFFGRYGLIENTGRQISNWNYEKALELHENRVAVNKNGLYGYLDEKGFEVIRCQYEIAHDFINGNAIAAKRKGKGIMAKTYYGIIDRNGNEVLPFVYDSIKIKNGIYHIRKGKNSLYFTSEGTFISEKDYRRIVSPFIDGLAIATSKGLFGFVSPDMKEVIPCVYNSVGNFSEGLAVVSRNDKWGFVDKEGNEVIPCQYVEVAYFSDGLAWVKDEEYHEYYIDKKGNKVIDLNYYNSYFSIGDKTVVIKAESKLERIQKERELLGAINDEIVHNLVSLDEELLADEAVLSLENKK